ncbi:four-carbon acid sugar kinase family protein [Thermoanaerobacterium thermosaccharolyticum]|uniref:four-carbon acid sugar kinase family protein n=1 Tax=Thermoanaerobacterium thermosaccharolyticum TaxID=1517 RepID=UPI003DA7C36C
MKKFLIIADDFTGANDTGVQLKKRGIKTNVILDSKYIINNQYNSYVIDTESRNISQREAYEKVKEVISTALKFKFDFVYKKVDSTLRGNIGAEINAIKEIYRPALIVFAPAYPDNKRTTINGIQMMNNVPVSKTEIANDPNKPVKEDNLKKLLEFETNEKAIHIYLEDVRNGKFNFKGNKLVSFDAETKEDLMGISKYMLNLNKKILWVGSAGLIDAILNVLYDINPVLCLIGSISKISRQQVEYMSKRGVKIVKVDVASLLNGKTSKNNIVDETVNLLNNKYDTALVTTLSYDDYEMTIKVGNDKGLSKENISKYTKEIIGEISKEVISRTKLCGVFLTGGDTAISFIDHIKAYGTEIIGEVQAGIPLAIINGGMFNGLKIITKAGAFGSEESIYYCIQKLKEVS